MRKCNQIIIQTTRFEAELHVELRFTCLLVLEFYSFPFHAPS